MSTQSLPLILEPDILEQHLHDKQILVVDLSKAENYNKYHIPGAIFLDYPRIIHIEKPVMGLLPSPEYLEQLFGSIGINKDTHVVAYDDEGGGKACRLLWTLDVMGHERFSLLNGGMHSWINEGHPFDHNPVTPAPTTFKASPDYNKSTDKQYILDHLSDNQVVLLDTRTPQEFNGTKKYSERGGHIPGAVNMDWVHAMDPHHNLRLLPEHQIRGLLQPLGVEPDKEIILYCQSHHRSSHTYIVLKSLGYQNLRGYPGAWSEWGNDPNTPVE